jgi:hypothetical protein
MASEKMVSDSEIKATLEDALEVTRTATGLDLLDLSVKHMGWVKGRENLKHGWYLQVQNFEDLNHAKKHGGPSAFRQTFRSMYLKDLDAHVLEVVEWRPTCDESRSTVDFTTQLLFGPRELILNSFHTMLCRSVLLSKSEDQGF